MSVAASTCGGLRGNAGVVSLEVRQSVNDKSIEVDPNTPRDPHTPPATSSEPRQTYAIGGGRPPRARPTDHEPTARTLTAAGRVTGEAHPCALHSDATVAEARRLGATGMTHAQVAQAIGVPHSTVSYWLRGARRPEPARTIVAARWRRSAKRSAAEAARLREKRAKARLEKLA